MTRSFDYILKNKLALEFDYPYLAEDNICKLTNGNKFGIKGYRVLRPYIVNTILKELQNLPVSIGMEV